MKFISQTNIGSRKKNEDYFYESDKLFVVCDGVGGSAYGEVASKLACSSFAEYFKQNSVSVYDLVYLNNALRYTIQKFQETKTKYPETKTMATTIVLVAFDENGAKIAHLGDSRLYHVRGGKILFQTDDHSLKNEMAKEGKDVSNISRNFITKALSAKTDYEFSFHGISKNELQQGDYSRVVGSFLPTHRSDELNLSGSNSRQHSQEQTPNDTANLQQGDYFFLCTDGVLENVNDEILSRELATDSDFETKAQTIFSLCEGKTKDNFTFQLIEL